jgi:hypothetical protein
MTLNMTLKSLLFCLLVAPAATISFAEETDPKIIREKVVAAYKALDTYSAEGKATTESDAIQGQRMIVETSFSMKMKKPNHYLITWNQTSSMIPGKSQSGAVWNSDSQPYLYIGAVKAYSKMTNDEMALGGATGISGGAACTIPSFFLAALPSQLDTFSRLLAPKLTDDEEIDGEECYVIDSSSAISKKETFWITKKSFLIKQCSRSLEPPEGGIACPAMSDEQLETTIKGLGQEVTKERKEAMRKKMKDAQTLVQAAHLKGTMTEHHTTIAMPTLIEKDFAFKVPDDVVLNDSLFGDFVDGKSSGAKPSVVASANKIEPAKPQSPKEQ